MNRPLKMSLLYADAHIRFISLMICAGFTL